MKHLIDIKDLSVKEIDDLILSLDSIQLDTPDLVVMTTEEYDEYLLKKLENADENSLYCTVVNN